MRLEQKELRKLAKAHAASSTSTPTIPPIPLPTGRPQSHHSTAMPTPSSLHTQAPTPKPLPSSISKLPPPQTNGIAPSPHSAKSPPALHPPHLSRKRERELDTTVGVAKDVVGVGGNTNAGINGIKFAPGTAKAGTPVPRPRPIKKQRMVRSPHSFSWSQSLMHVSGDAKPS